MEHILLVLVDRLMVVEAKIYKLVIFFKQQLLSVFCNESTAQKLK